MSISLDAALEMPCGNSADASLSSSSERIEVEESKAMETESSSILDATPKSSDLAENILAVVEGFVSKAGAGVGRSDNDRQFIFCSS